MINNTFAQALIQLTVNTNEILQEVIVLSKEFVVFNFESTSQLWNIATQTLEAVESGNPQIF
jgi:hypothetical protein